MLFKLVSQKCLQIGNRGFVACVDELAPLIQQHAQEAVADCQRRSRESGGNPTAQQAARGLAIIAAGSISQIPGLVLRMMDAVKDARIPATRRAAIASVLAYFAQPHDLFPEEESGLYGLLDDAILLRAGILEYLQELPQPELDLDHERHFVGILISLTPASVRPAIQQMISSLSLALQTLSQLDPALAEIVLRQIITNPLQASPPAAPQGFVPHPATNYEKGRWSGGAYFEGNNMVIPGGPSLIDGQLFIPS